MKAGDQVKVKKSVIVYNHPQSRGKPFELQGEKGEVFQVLNDWKGRPISPTLPIIVSFNKYRVHLTEDELEIVN
uniref:Putative ferredoxin-thioredoxin reductase, variable chain n=1 Tax=Paulinella longichromatophora TaxID=1708747 RepID=A0A2H4ZNN5_9EUKA|nr:putative ferredoxin-thioredoxin reductase, variable chain [Paulinella longichromatophora]